MSNPHSAVQFASALAVHDNLDTALQEVCEQVAGQLDGPPDLAVVFVSADRVGDCQQIADTICDRLQTEQLIGCTGESIIGVDREVEGETALSLWAARLPATNLRPMHLEFERSPEGGAIVGWPAEMDETWPSDTAIIVLGDPFSFPADAMLERLNEDRSGVPVVGGMASSGSAPGENRLIMGRRVVQEGAVALMLDGGVRLRTVVSQGCRPIGKPFVITRAEQNVIHELGGKPAVLQIKEIFDSLPTGEQLLVQKGLHVGRVVSEYQDHFQQGDFLIRNVMGIDPENGSVVVGDFVRAGQTVQFQIRDGQTADDEMRALLAIVRDAPNTSPAGALLFTCNGRGTRLFGEPHHDAQVVKQMLGNIPLAGFFAAGELGPVAGKNFMHGFTASIALFEPCDG